MEEVGRGMRAVLRADVAVHSAAMSICRCRQDWRGMHSQMHTMLRPETGDGGRRDIGTDVGANGAGVRSGGLDRQLMSAVLRADVGVENVGVCGGGRCVVWAGGEGGCPWRGCCWETHTVMGADVGAGLVWTNVALLVVQHRVVEGKRAWSSTVVCVVCAGRICDLQVSQGISNMVVLLTSVGSFCQRPFKFRIEGRNCESLAGEFLDTLQVSVEAKLVDDLPRPRPVNVDLAVDHVGVRPHRPRTDPRLLERRDDIRSVGRLVEGGQDLRMKLATSLPPFLDEGRRRFSLLISWTTTSSRTRKEMMYWIWVLKMFLHTAKIPRSSACVRCDVWGTRKITSIRLC